ncbi:MAG: FAD-dependent oxidoreductase [Bacteroidales bacterium]|nr:FAD-dependent oxidoreductase [Bacteroidales bacterium]
MKHVIVGGVAGGATAAARIRRIDESCEIILLEKGQYISYANCGLPYYIGGVIQEREKLFLQTPQSFSNRFNVDVRVEQEAISIDSVHKTVQIRKSNGEVYSETYDKLLLSPGAYPFMPPIKGIDSKGIFTLRNVPDTDAIKNYITHHSIKKAVVVGAGFIGLEMAENLHHTGAQVAIVEKQNQVMPPIDLSMAALAEEHLLLKGVALYLEKSVIAFERKDNQVEVQLDNGEILMADIVILSIGVKPETKLAKAAELKIGEAGGIWVDEYLQTSENDIYAVGDAIEFPHPITGKPWLNYLANPANRQGRIVADNMVFGNKFIYEGAIGTSIAKVFDITVASTGLAAKQLVRHNIPYKSSTTHSGSHAGYYPNAFNLTVKLTFHPENGKIFGAQCIGIEGIDKRIDQIALLIKKGGTIYDLIRLEHTYAPPFSSAKDPIAIAGYVAANILSGKMPVIYWRDIQYAGREKFTLLDVRTKDEFKLGSIPEAINIPVDELRTRLDEIPTTKPIAIFCQVGLRGYLAQQILIGRGFKEVFNLSGGYKTYKSIVSLTHNINKNNDTNTPQYSSKPVMEKIIKNIIKVDACGLQCPGPILKLKNKIDEIKEGEVLEVTSTDPGFSRDAEAWCNMTGNTLISSTSDKGKYTVVIEKGSPKHCTTVTTCDGKGKTLILFSQELDKALATFVLANGAAATGQKVTIFFTFWGLNVIKKVKKPKVKKDFFGKIFGIMLPSSSLKLKLSKFSMFGAGSIMMRYLMKSKGIDSLESLRQQALDNGVEFIACQMSMDVMGVSKEELMDEVTIGGVATYMGRADNANVNLFI